MVMIVNVDSRGETGGGFRTVTDVFISGRRRDMRGDRGAQML